MNELFADQALIEAIQTLGKKMKSPADLAMLNSELVRITVEAALNGEMEIHSNSHYELMLRSLKFSQFSIGDLGCSNKQLGTQSKMIKLVFNLQTFQFEKAVNRHKNMIILCGHSASGRFC